MANPKGTPQNLTRPGDGKHHDFTKEERKRGGEATRERFAMARLLGDFGKLTPDVEEIKARMKRFGVADDKVTNEAAIAVRIILGARNGDPKMIDRYLEATGQKIIRNINENHNVEVVPEIVDISGGADDKANDSKQED